VQSLVLDLAEKRAFAITSNPGQGPGQDPVKWRELFEGVVAKPAVNA
jgi:hypothetical protein